MSLLEGDPKDEQPMAPVFISMVVNRDILLIMRSGSGHHRAPNLSYN